MCFLSKCSGPAWSWVGVLLVQPSCNRGPLARAPHLAESRGPAQGNSAERRPGKDLKGSPYCPSLHSWIRSDRISPQPPQGPGVFSPRGPWLPFPPGTAEWPDAAAGIFQGKLQGPRPHVDPERGRLQARVTL